MMTPIKCVQTAVTSGWVPVKVEGHSWFAVKVEHVHALGSQTTWALVPDEASTCNPSEADIARRVGLLRAACTVTAHPSDVSGLGRYNYHFACLEDGPYYLQNRNLVWSAASPEEFAAEIERVAIRQLLSERGAK